MPPEHATIQDPGNRAKRASLGYYSLLGTGLPNPALDNGKMTHRFDGVNPQRNYDIQDTGQGSLGYLTPNLLSTENLPDVGDSSYYTMFAAVVNREIFFTGDGSGGELDPAPRDPRAAGGNPVTKDVIEPSPNLASDRDWETI